MKRLPRLRQVMPLSRPSRRYACAAPTADEDNKVGNVFDGEIYRALEASEDGLWVKIDVPELELRTAAGCLPSSSSWANSCLRSAPLTEVCAELAVHFVDVQT